MIFWKKFAEIAEAMEVVKEKDDCKKNALRSVEAVKELQKYFGIPTKMSKLGVKEELIPQMAQDTMLSGNVKVNPRQVNLEDVIELYKKCL